MARVERIVKEVVVLSKSDVKSLEKDIQKYFSEHIHTGFAGPFSLECLKQANTNNLLWYAIPAGLGNEDIWDLDEDFNKGLQAVGQKYKIGIALPYWLYSK